MITQSDMVDEPMSDEGLSGAELLLRQYAKERSVLLRNQIVEAYLYIASIIASKFSGRGVDYDDLYQVASLALVKAVDRFDVTKGVKFASFATPTMTGEVKNYFRDRSRTIKVPRRSGELIQQLEQAKSVLEQDLLRSPTVDELADYCGIPIEDVLEAYEMAHAVRPASLDATLEEDDASLHSFFGFEDRGYGDVETQDLLDQSFEKLNDMEREIIKGRYFDNLSQRELAARLHVSQMTVSRVERRALKMMRDAMDH